MANGFVVLDSRVRRLYLVSGTKGFRKHSMTPSVNCALEILLLFSTLLVRD